MNNEKIDNFLDEYSDLCNRHKMFIGALSKDAFFSLRVCIDDERDCPLIIWDSKNKKFIRGEHEQR